LTRVGSAAAESIESKATTASAATRSKQPRRIRIVITQVNVPHGATGAIQFINVSEHGDRRISV